MVTVLIPIKKGGWIQGYPNRRYHLNRTNLISHWEGQLKSYTLSLLFFLLLRNFSNYQVERQSLWRR